MHNHSSRPRRRISTRAGHLTLALGACLCAGQLLPAVPASAAPVDPASWTVTLVADEPARVANGPANPLRAAVPLEAAVPFGTVLAGTADSGTVSTPVSAGTTSARRRAARIRAARVRAARQRKVIAEARRLRGRPYRYGATGPRAFDCSGYTQFVFRKVGRRLPHSADAQQRRGRPVRRSQARPGDLIIFRSGGYGYHAAIYAGNGYMYDAPRPGARVGKHKIWSRNYVVRRLV